MENPLNLMLVRTYTRMDALRRLRVLRQILEGRLFGLGETPVLSPEDNNWLNGMDTNFYNFFNRDNLYKLFNEIENNIKKSQTLTIYLPFELPLKELATLGEYLRKDYGKNFLVEVKFDPSLIGGCSLVWNSVIKDYSLRKKMEEQKVLILNSLTHMIKND